MGAPTILVHGGAGARASGAVEDEGCIRNALCEAVRAAHAVLEGKDGSALDAVQVAVVHLERCPLFNAGRGSVLNEHGEVEMDAALMCVAHQARGRGRGRPEISTATSLVVILVVLAITTVASLLKVRRDPSARAHAGSRRGHPREARPAGASR